VSILRDGEGTIAVGKPIGLYTRPGGATWVMVGCTVELDGKELATETVGPVYRGNHEFSIVAYVYYINKDSITCPQPSRLLVIEINSSGIFQTRKFQQQFQD